MRELGEGDLGGVEHDAACRSGATDNGDGQLAQDLLRVGLGKDHAVRQACGLEHAAGAGDGVAGKVGGHNARGASAGALGLGEGVGVQLGPRGFVVLGPAKKAPAFAVDAGGAPGEDGGRLEGDAAAGAAQVDEDREGGGGGVAVDGLSAVSARLFGCCGVEVAAGVDACVWFVGFSAIGRSCGIVFCGGRRGVAGVHQRVGARLLPVDLRERERGVVGAQHVGRAGARGLARQALEERVAGEIELQAGAVAADREGEAAVGAIGVHGGAFAQHARQAVADGILHAQGGEVRVAQLVGGAARRNGERGAGTQDVLPRDGGGVLVKLVGVAGVKARERDKDAAGEARPQARAVCVRSGPDKGDAALEAAHLAQAQTAQLVGKGDLEALRAAGVELVRCLA